MSRTVTEQDLRAPEFREGTPDEYEYRDDGKIVRKDRFMRGMQDIAAVLYGPRYDYEIPEVIERVRELHQHWIATQPTATEQKEPGK